MEIDGTIHDNLPQEELHSMWTPSPPHQDDGINVGLVFLLNVNECK